MTCSGAYCNCPAICHEQQREQLAARDARIAELEADIVRWRAATECDTPTLAAHNLQLGRKLIAQLTRERDEAREIAKARLHVIEGLRDQHAAGFAEVIERIADYLESEGGFVDSAAQDEAVEWVRALKRGGRDGEVG